MKKILFLFSFFIFGNNLVFADYLNTKFSNKCVSNFYPYPNSRGFCYVLSHNNNERCGKSYKVDDFIAGYEFVNGDCSKREILSNSDITAVQWESSMMTLAHSLGFMILFLANFIGISIARS